MVSTTHDAASGPSTRDVRFLQSLRDMRTKGEQQRAQALERDEQERRREVAEQLRALDEVQRLREQFEGLAADLVTETPAFGQNCRLFDGRYLLELGAREPGKDAHGRPRHWLSRLAFLVRIDGAELEVACHKTVHDRDLPITRVRARRGDVPGEHLLKAFLDEEFLAFAQAYFGAGLLGTTPTDAAPLDS